MKKSLIIFAVTLAAFANPVKADLILGGQLFYTGGDVTVTVLEASAGYHSFLGLYLLDPTSQQGSDLAENHDTGSTISFDPSSLGYGIGDELVFGISVYTSGSHDDPNNFQATYFMGPADRNPDGIMHAILNTDEAPGVYIVGFEDLYGGGDRDFNDNVFSFVGGIRSVPEPGTLLLLGAGLLGIGARRQLQKKAG